MSCASSSSALFQWIDTTTSWASLWKLSVRVSATPSNTKSRWKFECLQLEGGCNLSILASAIEQVRTGYGVLSTLGLLQHPTVAKHLSDSGHANAKEHFCGKQHWGFVDSIVYHTDVIKYTKAPKMAAPPKDDPKHPLEPEENGTLNVLAWRAAVDHFQERASGHNFYEVTQVGAASLNGVQNLNDSLVPPVLSDSSFMSPMEQLNEPTEVAELAVRQKQDDVLVPTAQRDVALPPALSECEIQKLIEQGHRMFFRMIHKNPSAQHILVSESSRALMAPDAAVPQAG